MKIKFLLAILVIFLMASLQTQASAQSTAPDWLTPHGEDPQSRNNNLNVPPFATANVWRPMNGTGLPPLTELNINVIVADPINPKIVYLGTSKGVYRTTDGGLNWAAFNAGLASGAGINLMAITPDGGVLYARDGNYASMGLFRTSTAGSAAWTKLTTPIGSDANSIFSIYINSSYVYIGLYSIGMYKSSNQGDAWIQMEHAPINTIDVITGVSTDSNLIYAAVVSPYKTTDGGEKWEYLSSFNVGVNPCRAMGYMSTIAIDPARTNVVLFGDDNACLMRSEDGGKTLSMVYVGVGVERVLFDPRNSDLAYLSATTSGIHHDGVMKSSDNGKTWVDYNSGLPWMGTTGFELGPGADGKPSVLYAGMTRKGVYTTAPPILNCTIFLPTVRR